VLFKKTDIVDYRGFINLIFEEGRIDDETNHNRLGQDPISRMHGNFSGNLDSNRAHFISNGR